jgi:hypothetical protein
MRRIAFALTLFALVAVAPASGYRVVILGQDRPTRLRGTAVDWPFVATEMSFGRDFNRGSAPLLWDSRTNTSIDLRPPRMVHGFVSAIAKGVQAGRVTPADFARSYACMWRGTPESFVWLHPFPTAGGFDSTVNDTDGTYQVGRGSDGNRDLALVWKGTRESVQVYNPPGSRHASATGVDWPYVCGSAAGYGALLWIGGPAKIVPLQPFPYQSSYANATRNGVQVGAVAHTATSYPFGAMWRGSASTFRLLHKFGWMQSRIQRTNGFVHVGWAQRYSDYRRIAIAFHGVESPRYIDLDALLPPYYVGSEARNVDDNGVIVGVAYLPSTTHTVLWIPNP